jgi:hypothetical protein
MSLPEQMYTKLSTTTAVSSLIGNRIYPEYDLSADKVYPLAVYKIENVTPQLASDGPTGLESADYIIAAISPTYGQAQQVARAIYNALEGYSVTTDDIQIQGCFLKDDGFTDNVMTEQESERILFYITEASFQVWYALNT